MASAMAAAPSSSDDVELHGAGAPKDSLALSPADDGADGGAPYYWEAGGNDDVDSATAVLHNAHWWGTVALAGVDSVGGVLASFLGLTQSRYQYEIDYAERQRAHIRRQIIIRRQRELIEREVRKRELQRRAGQPEDTRTVEQAASESFKAESERRKAGGIDELREAVRAGLVPAEAVPDDIHEVAAAAALTFTQAADAVGSASLAAAEQAERATGRDSGDADQPAGKGAHVPMDAADAV